MLYHNTISKETQETHCCSHSATLIICRFRGIIFKHKFIPGFLIRVSAFLISICLMFPTKKMFALKSGMYTRIKIFNPPKNPSVKQVLRNAI